MLDTGIIHLSRGKLSGLAASVIMALALVTALTQEARAVLVEADSIEADGASSTVDLWFFSFASDTVATIKVNDLGGPPVVGADPDLIIYRDDGLFSTIFASDTAAGTDPDITANFLAGSYIGVVGNHLLNPGSFGPFMADAALAVGGYDYEFNLPAPGDVAISINCVLSGNLDGSYSKRVFQFGAGDTCRLPPTQVPEPGTAPLFILGLCGLLLWTGKRLRTV